MQNALWITPTPSFDQSIQIAASEQANVSYPQQTADAVQDTTHKWASLDGSWVLDGTYHLAPTEDLLTQYQFGWWGAQLAGENGAFSEPYPALTVTHFPRPVHSLKVVGDSARGEYPVDFTIDLYAQDDTLLYTKSVTGNTLVAYACVLPSPVLDVAKQVLTITKWGHAGRQAKIAEFFTSIQETYLAGDLVNLHLLEEREASQGSLPVGNITANEITLALNNESKKFDVDNDQSPLHGLLKPNRKIRTWLGMRGTAHTEVEDDFTEDSSAEYQIFNELPATWDTVNGWMEAGSAVMSGGVARLQKYGFGAFHLRVMMLSDRGDGQPSDDIHVAIAAIDHISNGSDGFTAVLRPLTDTVSFQPTMAGASAFDTPCALDLDTWYTVSWLWESGRVRVWIDNSEMTGDPLVDYAYDAMKYPRAAGWTGVGVSGSKVRVSEIQAPRVDFTGAGDYEEWAPLGIFWSLDWDSPDDRLEATVTARDRLELLRKGTYQTSQVQTNVSLYTLAEQVLQSAGLGTSEYVIDSALQAISVPYAWFDPVAPREALRIIAEAALAVVYADRDGKVRITSFAMSGGQSVLTLTEDDYFPPLRAPSRQESVANEIIVTTQPLMPAAAVEEVYRSNNPVTIPAGQTVTVTAYYNQPPVIDAAASLDNPPAGVSLESATYYGWGAEVAVKNANGADQQATLVITGKPLTVQNKDRSTARDETSITENGVLRYEFPDNPLVQTAGRAQQIADALLASAKDSRRDTDLDWRGNPALELGDRVTVKGQDYYAIRQELEWAGALGARLTGRKAV